MRRKSRSRRVFPSTRTPRATAATRTRVSARHPWCSPSLKTARTAGPTRAPARTTPAPARSPRPRAHPAPCSTPLCNRYLADALYQQAFYVLTSSAGAPPSLATLATAPSASSTASCHIITTRCGVWCSPSTSICSPEPINRWRGPGSGRQRVALVAARVLPDGPGGLQVTTSPAETSWLCWRWARPSAGQALSASGGGVLRPGGSRHRVTALRLRVRAAAAGEARGE